MGLSASDMVLIETYWNVKILANIGEQPIYTVLIETYWNVKSSPAAELVSEPISINRNILECKVVTAQSSHSLTLVLIETYWNVKGKRGAERAAGPAVLIETYWNVKFYPWLAHSLISCINRNILECKGRNQRRFGRTTYRINRNILECKDI